MRKYKHGTVNISCFSHQVLQELLKANPNIILSTVPYFEEDNLF